MTLSKILVVATLAVAAGCSGVGPDEHVGETSSAGTFTNDQPAFDYFRGKGLTAVQAAGVVGNLDQESGVDPTSVQGGGPGRGIAQWSVGGRWDTDSDDNATWYASKEGEALLSLQLQLDFVWYELTTFPGYGLADLQAATTVTAATVAFETDFEGCGECDQSQRVAYAENVLAAFGGTPIDAGSSGADAATTCTVGATGASGVCLGTTTCAAGGGTSTPDYCPGPADIQCCTGLASGGDDAGKAGDAGHPHDAAGGSSSASGAHDGDAAVVDAPSPLGDGDDGGPKTSMRVSPPAEGPDASDEGDSGGDGGGGGCAVAASPADGWPWLGSLVGLGVARRRRRRAAKPVENG